MSPYLSIIIPVYNLTRWLDRCLTSIITQTFIDFEVLLVNDGSIDGSAELCERWQRRDKRIRVFHKSNGGVSSARNLGLDNATGNFVTFVDGDDYILPGMYERIITLQKEHDADIAICGFANEQKDGTFVPYFTCDRILVLAPQEQLRCLFENRYYSCSCGDKIFRRTCIQELRFDINISHYEDLLFCYEAMKHARKAVFTAEPFYRYCANDSSSASRKPFGKEQMTMLDVWDYLREDVLEKFPQLNKDVNVQYYRNYIMCAMMAHQSKYDAPRIRQFLRYNLIRIICSPLSLGYKWQAIKNCF